MKSGSWPSIISIFFFGVCGASAVSKLIPLAGDIGQTFGLSGSDFGWLVALLALPAAVFAIPSGVVVDRFGSKRVLLLAALLGVAANTLYYFANSLPLLYAARIAEGLAVVHIYTAAPALLISTTEGARRTKAMSLWSTYAPIGTAIGLGLGGLFAESANWNFTFASHGGMFAVAGFLAIFQPKVEQSPQAARSLGERVGELFGAFRRPQLVSLGMAFMMVISMGVGANLTLPLFVAEVHNLSAGAASSMVASVTLTMVIGSVLGGYFVARGIRPTRLFAALAISGAIFGTACFYPPISVPLRYAVMLGWFLLSGAALATIMTTLPLAADPKWPGAAAALLNFAGALAALLNPPLWLGIFESGQWLPFSGLFAGGWLLAVIMMWLVARYAVRAGTVRTNAPD